MAITKMGGEISKGPVYVSFVKDLPQGNHYAVLVNKTNSYWDDGQHSSENFLQYIGFETKEALQRWIIDNHSRETFKVISVEPLPYELKAVITFGQ